jgi:ATP phosphoribosyltransferase
MKKLKFALPKGSLNDLNRGNTEALLKEAGFDIQGYSPSSRSYSPIIKNDLELETIVDRPQNMPLSLKNGIYDLGILGEDIAEENRLARIDLMRLCDLEYGYADLVVAVSNSSNFTDLDSYLIRISTKEIIRCETEYPFITQDRIYRNQTYQKLFGNKKPVIVSKYGRFGDNPKLIITQSEGATESAINPKQSADFIVESSSSGKTLGENNLKAIETLLKSSAGLYTTEEVLKDSWKADKIDFVKTMLEGVIKARKTNYIVFNLPRQKERTMLDYLEREKLFAKEPTITKDGRYLQIGIEVLKSRWAEIVYGLKKKGAEDIIRFEPTQIIE